MQSHEQAIALEAGIGVFIQDTLMISNDVL